MNIELKAYIKAEATISAAFSFFINGMVAALVHHKVDMVPTDAISIAIDLTATCLLMFTISALFCRASVRRTKTVGILQARSRVMRFLGGLHRHPVLFGALVGSIAAAVLFAITAPLFALLGIYAIPFGMYVALKCIFTALLGGGVTTLALYAGMISAG